MATSAQTLIIAAIAQGYDRLSDRDLREALLYAAQTGGGGGSGGVPTGNYAGGQPNFTPATSGAVAIDTSNSRIWWWALQQPMELSMKRHFNPALVVLLAWLPFVGLLTGATGNLYVGNFQGDGSGLTNLQNSSGTFTNIYINQTYISNAFVTNETVYYDYVSVSYITNLYATTENVTTNYITNAYITQEFVTNENVKNSTITNLTVITNTTVNQYVSNAFVTNLTVVTNEYVNNSYITNLTILSDLTNQAWTPNTALYADANKAAQSSPTTSTELGYVHNVTSAIQTQLNALAPTNSPTLYTPTITGNFNASGATNVPMVTSRHNSDGGLVHERRPGRRNHHGNGSLQTTNSGDEWIFATTVTNAINCRFALPWDWNAGTVQVGLRATSAGTNFTGLTNMVFGVRAGAIGNGDSETNLTWGTAIGVTNGFSTNNWISHAVITRPAHGRQLTHDCQFDCVAGPTAGRPGR